MLPLTNRLKYQTAFPEITPLCTLTSFCDSLFASDFTTFTPPTESLDMPTKRQFVAAAKIAVQNLIKHGDTDIFPFPFESHAFFDNQQALVNLIYEYDQNFDDYLTRFPPTNINALTPTSYYGFRWATQLDPIWNMHFLSCVLVIRNQIETARIPLEDNIVFSYRIKPNRSSGDLFDRRYNWRQFMLQSLKKSQKYEYVVTCDISEFYPRLGHHRLENALLQVAADTGYPAKIMAFLSNFSNTRSFGLPIGGPAARILSELTINQIDRLLRNARIDFTRFADDFHIFAASREDAYRHTVLLSEKLFENQGLSLQKSKTRIMTSAEFRATCPVKADNTQSAKNTMETQSDDQPKTSGELLTFSLRFDPYSPTADEDYEKLKQEIAQFDILGLLKQELAKSRVHIALSRKLISAVRYLDGQPKDDAVVSIANNSDMLYPIFSSALVMMEQVYDELGDTAKLDLVNRIVELIRTESHVFRLDVHLCYAIRILQHAHSEEVQQLLKEIYTDRNSEIVRRDIILVMALWGDWYWLSDVKNRYHQMSGPEKRAFLVASYALKDEGKHWRKNIKGELNSFEAFILDWAKDRVNKGNRKFPL